jgi:hypothetical protein
MISTKHVTRNYIQFPMTNNDFIASHDQSVCIDPKTSYKYQKQYRTLKQNLQN